MYLAQVFWYDVFCAVTQLARRITKPSKHHMRVAKHMLRYLGRSTDFSTTFQLGGFKIDTISDANGDNNPDNGQVNIVVHRDARQRPNQFLT